MNQAITVTVSCAENRCWLEGQWRPCHPSTPTCLFDCLPASMTDHELTYCVPKLLDLPVLALYQLLHCLIRTALHVACQLAARHQHRAALRAVRAGDHEGWAGLRAGKQDGGAAILGEEDDGG